MEKLVILVCLLSACLPAAHPWHYRQYNYEEAARKAVVSEEPTKQTCGSDKVKEFKDKITEISNDLDALMNKVQVLELSKLGICACQQPTSCADVLKNDPNAKSGYYMLQKSDCSTVRVYCHMTLDCKGVAGGWMQVSFFH